MDSCGEELEQFIEWMKENHPEIETSSENVMSSSYTINGEVKEEYFWDEYCNA